MSRGIEVGIYESHEELFGRRATLQELVSEIRRHSVASVLWICALVIVAESSFRMARDSDLEIYGRLIDLFFPRALAIRFRTGIMAKAPRREIFHRRQILLIAKLAIQHCGMGKIISPNRRFRINSPQGQRSLIMTFSSTEVTSSGTRRFRADHRRIHCSYRTRQSGYSISNRSSSPPTNRVHDEAASRY